MPGEDMAFRERVDALAAPESDGQAAVCKTAEAGSTPAGASHLACDAIQRGLN